MCEDSSIDQLLQISDQDSGDVFSLSLAEEGARPTRLGAKKVQSELRTPRGLASIVAADGEVLLLAADVVC